MPYLRDTVLLCIYTIFKPGRLFDLIDQKKYYSNIVLIFFLSSIIASLADNGFIIKYVAEYVTFECLIAAIFIIVIMLVAKILHLDMGVIKLSSLIFIVSLPAVFIRILSNALPSGEILFDLIAMVWPLALFIAGMRVIGNLKISQAALLGGAYILLSVIMSVGILYTDIGRYLMLDKDIKAEIYRLRKCITTRPENVDNYTRLGILFSKAKLYQYGIDSFEEGLRASMGEAECSKILLYNIGLNLLALKNKDGAVDKLQASLKIDRQYLPSLKALGLAYEEKGMPDEALRIWKEALEYGPGDEWLLNKVGR